MSDLLAATAVELRLPILDTPLARRRLQGAYSSPLTASRGFAAAAARPGARIYTNSENALPWVTEHLQATDLPRRVGLLKDKIAFRESLADLYPDYRYVGLPASALRSLDPSRLRAPFVVKPALGFFSLGVRVVESAAAWPDAVADLEREARALGAMYPNQVLGLDRFVVEEVIEGEEFALDAYYDADGAPVLVNVYAHLFASATDVSDRVYITNAETVLRLGPPAMAFLKELGRRAGLADFPVHAELRLDDRGHLAPIEVNPLRFGGWCATDLAQFAYGLNPYRCYLLDERPDWTRIAEKTAGRTTALIVAGLPTSVDLATIAAVDYERFAARFGRVLELRPTDYNRYPVFAFAFVDVPSDDLSELQAVLNADLSTYLRLQG